MTTYYTVTGNPPAATRGVSSSVRAEFVLIQTAFADVNTTFTTTLASIALKGAIAGQVWTGTHDFTGATITVPTQAVSDATTKAASTAFVNALVTATSFAGSLPTQTGNAGKFPTTDGTTASWSALLKDGTIRFANSSDLTKLLAFDVSGVTTATTRTVAIPNKSGTMAMTSDLVLTTEFLSADQTITSAGALTIAHSLGAIPKLVLGFLKCVTGELGYTAGDVVCLPLGQDGSGTSTGVSVVVNATNLVVRFGSAGSPIVILDKSSGAGAAITTANWTFHMRAFT